MSKAFADLGYSVDAVWVLLMPFGFLALKNFKVILTFQSYDFECTR